MDIRLRELQGNPRLKDAASSTKEITQSSVNYLQGKKWIVK